MRPEFGLLHPRCLLATAVLQLLLDEDVAGRPSAILRATPPQASRTLALVGLLGRSRADGDRIDLERGVTLVG